MACGSYDRVWPLSHMFWEHLKDFKQQSKQDLICILEDHRGNHVEAGLEVWRLAAGNSQKATATVQEGGMGPDLRQPQWGCKQREEGRC